MCRRHRHSLVCQSQRRGDESRPGEPAVLAPERVEPGGEAGHGAGGRADGVVNELLAERDVELEELAARSTRDGAEAVEIARRPLRASQ